jgi:hypothetical protein
MPYIIVIDKTGIVKETNIKEYKESDLYKKANFKSAEGFSLQTQWSAKFGKKSFNVSVYGKTAGKAGQENKYELPPPIDSVLFFGGLVLTNTKESGEIGDLRVSEWEGIYEDLMGGFEDLDETGDEEEDDDLDGLNIGKDGYAIDDFVVEDDDEIDYDNLSADEEEEDEDLEEEEELPKKKTSSKTTNKSSAKKPAKKNNKKKVAEELEQLQNNYLDCQSELSEEDYLV